MLLEKIPKEDWLQFCDMFSRQHEGWRGRVELVDDDHTEFLGREELPLVGVTADVKTKKGPIAIILANNADHITHLVPEPITLIRRQTDDGADEGLAIESANGSTTLLRFRAAAVPETLDGVLP
jgi:hypothetical protein